MDDSFDISNACPGIGDWELYRIVFPDQPALNREIARKSTLQFEVVHDKLVHQAVFRCICAIRTMEGYVALAIEGIAQGYLLFACNVINSTSTVLIRTW